MAEKILIVDDDVDTLRLVGIMLQRQGYQIVAATNGQMGLGKAAEEKPDLILLDVMMPDMDGFEVTRRLRKNDETARTPILMFTAKAQLDDKVSGFEAGVDDYLAKPTHPSELQTHIKALLSRARAGQQPELEKRSHLVAVLAARGGLGVSTLALNLGVGLFTHTQSQVVVVEMVPGKGTLSLDLGVASQRNLVKFLTGPASGITRDKVRNSLVSHISGVHLLLASDHPSDFSLINNVPQYEALIKSLTSTSRFAILDMGSGLYPFAKNILPMCNNVIVVLEGIPNAILHTKTLISDLVGMGVHKDRILAVLNNRVRSDMQTPASTVQEKLGHPVAFVLAPAADLILQATRMQTAAILCQPDGAFAKQILKLADQISLNEALG